MTDLCNIMNNHGSDKGSGWHNYTLKYHDMFNNRRNESLNIFEMGIGDGRFVKDSLHNAKIGASIKGWKEYFSKSNIYGADIDRNILFEEDRLKTFYCDQLDPDSISNMWLNPDLSDKKFDIIIDDGLHEYDSNINFFRGSIHKLKKDGVFIIEDLHQITLRRFKEELKNLRQEYNYLNFEIHEIPNAQNKSDNNLLIIRYKSNNELSDINDESIVINNKTKKVIDCFTFYNELEILELRLAELYDVVDLFILVEAEKTHKGENKRFIFEENKWRFEKWLDKIINVKVYYPSHIEDAWGREKFQRNSFMPTLYTLGLRDEDIVFVTDVDEILNPERVNYIKTSYDLKVINKMEMTTYFGNFYNKEISNKWYHPKVVNWGTLKSITPDNCRLDFNCQWWENGGWHLTYFGGPERIANKLENFAHQEYNKDEFKDIDRIERSLSEGIDLFGEWRKFERIDPEKNPNLPNNWRILENGLPKILPEKKKNLVLGAAIGLSGIDVINFVKSFREFNQEDDVYLITNISPKSDLISVLNQYNIKTLSSSFNTIYNMNFNLNIYRFYKYLDFVTENKKKYKNILITDVTDVVFQSNPFDIDTKKEFIIFSEEYEKERLIDNSFNSRWVSIALGNDVLNRIGDNPIICAGTTIGSCKNILNYLKSMVMIMTEKVEMDPSIVNESIDQGVHNFIVRTRSLIFKNMEIKPCGDFVATIGITCQKDPESIKIEEHYINVNGMKPSIVHQYNRSNEINNFYDGKYKS